MVPITAPSGLRTVTALDVGAATKTRFNCLCMVVKLTLLLDF